MMCSTRNDRIAISFRRPRIQQLFIILAALMASFQDGNSLVQSWTPNKNKAPLLARTTSRIPSSTTQLHINIPLPFFASSSENEKKKEGRASITDRFPIGKLFDSRDYIFNTASNVRGYEWTTKETDELIDDLVDACSGSLVMYDGDESSASKLRQDYELSQIVLIPMEWDQDALGLGGRYDVHDGQQRLITLCLLFAAMRERFQQLDGMEEAVTELANMLKPPKTRKAEILRVEMNPRDNEVLANILAGTGTDKIADLSDASPKIMEKLSKPNQQIVKNYNHISKRMQSLEQYDLLQLLDYTIEKVYMLVCVPESASIARNIVMGQGKGKDHEVIDDFKGLVCFRYTTEEKDMYQTFDAWDSISSSVLDLEAGVVGRQTVSDACLMRATCAMKYKIPTRKQLFALEQWLRGEMSSSTAASKSIPADGSDFYKIHVQPASLALGQFREGTVRPFGFSKRGKITKAWPGIVLRLDFLRETIRGVPATKELEMVILDLLLRAQGSVGGGKNKPLSLDNLQRYLSAVEKLLLYFALVRPTARDKYAKCFALLEAIEDETASSSKSSSGGKFETLTEDESFAMYEAVSFNSMNSNAAGKRLSLALLKRLNRSVMLTSATAADEAPAHLEPILPNKATKKAWGDTWPNKADRDVWAFKLGNMCLVSEPVPAKEAKRPFREKKGRYAKEPWPLTARLCDREVWDETAIKESGATIVGLMRSIWE